MNKDIGWMEEFDKNAEFQQAYMYESAVEPLLTKVEGVMLAKRLSRRDLAQKIGCPIEKVDEVFEGDPSFRMLCSIAWAVGLTILSPNVVLRAQ